MLSVFTSGFHCIKSKTKKPLDSVKFDFHLHDDYEIFYFVIRRRSLLY